MARRKEAEPLIKVTLNLYANDYVWLQDNFPNPGAAVVIRALIRQYRGITQRRIAAQTDHLVDEIDIDLEQLEGENS